MGYRQYLYEVDRALADRIKKCKTNNEFVSVIESVMPNIVSRYDDEEPYVPLYDIGKEIFGFGKYYENSNEMYAHGDSLFSSAELNKKYSDYGAIIIDEEGIKSAIDWNQQHVIKMYEDLLREKSIEQFDERSQLERLKDNADTYLKYWKLGPANMDKKNPRLSRSWLYEHEYFDLIRIYKTFDWENKAMMFMGW